MCKLHTKGSVIAMRAIFAAALPVACGVLVAEVAQQAAMEGLRMQRHWDAHRIRRPRFQVTGEMLAGMPLMRQGLCAFEKRFRRSAPPARPAAVAAKPFVLLFVGDSTMRNLFHALCLAMNVRQMGEDQGKHCVASCAGRLTEHRRHRGDGRGLRFGDSEPAAAAEGDELRARRNPDVVALFAGSTAVDPDAVRRTLALLERDASPLGVAWKLFGRRPPDAVFFGAGLWLQWPTPFAPAKHQWTSYAYWLNYEQDLAHAIANYSAAAPAARVATTTTHSQCDFQFQNDFKTVVDEAAAHGKPFAARDCERWLREGLGGTGALDDCVAGLRSRDASEALNGRLRRFLYRRGEAAVPYVGLVDAFALGDGRCDNNLPGDAIHFHGLLYEELTLLLETLGWRAPDGAEARDCPRAKRNWNATDR